MSSDSQKTSLLRRVVRQVRSAETTIGDRVGLRHPDHRVAADAQSFWAARDRAVPAENSHWRGHGVFADDAVWLEIGRSHFQMFEGFARLCALHRPTATVLEWGCGGGANAVHFGREAERFIGVDVSQASLDECGRQMRREGISARYEPVLVEVGGLDAAAAKLPGAVDLFVCTYVFELIPSQAYGIRLLEIAHRVLRPGGMAFIQIKYQTDNAWTRSRTWGYLRDHANMTTYRIEEFWQHCRSAGLTPRAVTLVPAMPAVRDERYAYFAITK